MSKRVHQAPDAATHVPAQCGAPYVIERHRNVYHLARNVTRGDGRTHHMRILMDRRDVIAVTNALIDLIEGAAAR